MKSTAKTLIFLHIPKTAGTTVNHMLNKRYLKKHSFIIDNNRPTASIKNDLANKSLEEREKIKMIHGHHFYGIHKYAFSSYTYFTILRDPVERCISLYKQLIRNKDSKIGQQIIKEKISLKELIEAKLYHEFDNEQCKRMAGYIPPYGTCDQKLYNVALANIEKDFLIVGIQDYLDESLLLLSQKLKWKIPPYYIPLNQSIGKKKIDLIIDQDTIDTIVKYNEFDIMLYQKMKARLEQAIVKNKNIRKKVVRFRRQNNLFQKIVNVYLNFKK